MHHPSVITIFKGGMVTIPSHGSFMKPCWAYTRLSFCAGQLGILSQWLVQLESRIELTGPQCSSGLQYRSGWVLKRNGVDLCIYVLYVWYTICYILYLTFYILYYVSKYVIFSIIYDIFNIIYLKLYIIYYISKII